MTRSFTHHYNLPQFLRVCGMVCLEDLNFKRAGRHFIIKYGLRIKCAVVVSATSMVATDDEVGCAHVLAEYSMKHSLFRAGIKHIKTITGNHRAVLDEVQLDHFTDRRIANRCGDISLLQFAKQHMDDQAVTTQTVHCHMTKFFVGQMHRVTCLESNYLLPAALSDFVADFDRRTEGIGEFILEV